MIKLVASDLDGTLLFKGAQSLPEEIFPLIRQLKELGILFVAASGRQYANMKKMFAPQKVFMTKKDQNLPVPRKIFTISDRKQNISEI